MSDKPSNPPHLVSVPHPDSEAAAESETTEATPERPGRGALFWIVVAVALFSLIGHAYQSQRLVDLRAANAALAGELYSTRAALDAYTDRFSAVRDTVAGLNAQIDALNALVAEEPEAATAAPAPGATR